MKKKQLKITIRIMNGAEVSPNTDIVEATALIEENSERNLHVLRMLWEAERAINEQGLIRCHISMDEVTV